MLDFLPEMKASMSQGLLRNTAVAKSCFMGRKVPSGKLFYSFKSLETIRELISCKNGDNFFLIEVPICSRENIENTHNIVEILIG